MGPLNEEKAQHKRIKENYEQIIIELMYDEGFVKLYNKYDPKNAKLFSEIGSSLAPEIGAGEFFNLIEEEAEKERLAKVPIVEDPMEVVLEDAAYMFNLEEINGPIQKRRLARETERAEIQDRIQDEATNEFAYVGLMFDTAEKEAEETAEAKVLAERQRQEDVANDVVLEGIAGLFVGDEVAEVLAEEVIEAHEVVVENPRALAAEVQAEEEVVMEGEAPETGGAAEVAPVPIAGAPAAAASADDKAKLEIEAQEKTKTEELDTEKVKEEEAKMIAAKEEAGRAEEARIVEQTMKDAENMVNATLVAAVEEYNEVAGAMYSSVHIRDIAQMNSNVISNRMMHTTTSVAAVAAGDEDEKVLDKGVWIAGLYGTNKQGSQKGFAGYKGHASGGTIGFDIGFDNYKDIVGIAYTKLDSKFKSVGGKLNTTIDSHILALYGQKELPKNFAVQAMFAYNHNIVKSKINRLGTIATGKYKNDNYNFETLLSYNYLTSGNIAFTPNIGVRYGHSKDGMYKEGDIGIQHLTIAAKKQNLWTGILGGSVALAPQKISEGLSITPMLQASVENYFNNKSKKLNAKIKWKDREVEQNIVLPKQPKVGYNIGASVLAQKGNVDVLVEYNCHLQKKYQSHQGFVKLKINF